MGRGSSPLRGNGLRNPGWRLARRRGKDPRGYTLVLVIILLVLLAAAIAAMAAAVSASSSTTAEMSKKRKMFYACDGLSRIVTHVTQGYLSTVDTDSFADMTAFSTALENHICTTGGGTCPALPSLTPTGFTVTAFDAEVLETTTGPVPSGPFADMNAAQTTVRLSVRAQSSTGGYACEQAQEVTLAQIGLFQFFVFAEDFFDFYPGANATVTGRIHVNGDICMGSSATLRTETITAFGEIYAGTDIPRCRDPSPGGLQVLERGTASTYLAMDDTNDHSCTTCGATPWAEYALGRWKGNVLDSDHDVPLLKVPVAGDPPVQDGTDAAGGVANNTASQRFLIDPPAAGESTDVGDQRLAIQADLRIINGVWYLRDPDFPHRWPGTPIWSDHPGRYTATDHEGVDGTDDVGQADIAAARGYGATLPHYYSYYEYDATLRRLVEDNRGIISYGALFRDGTGAVPSWRPGFFMNANANAPTTTPADPDGQPQHRFCAFNASGGSDDVSSYAADDKNVAASGTYGVVDALQTGRCHTCTGPIGTIDGDCSDLSETLVDVGIGGQVLEAARMGFHDQRAETAGAGLGRILPVNFDVAQLAAALADTSTGELGDHFSGSRPPFNGIVYISYTWDDQMDGLGNGGGGTLPGLWPDPTLAADPTQPLHHTDQTVGAGSEFADDWATSALPWPLCSGDGPVGTTGGLGYGGGQRIGFTGPTDNTVTTWFEPVFTIPSCNPANSPTTRPNAVRIINASTIDPTVFPGGLTIATNLPAYVLGDANTHSRDVLATASTADDAEWRPLLVAADAVTLLSKVWHDGKSPWTRAPDLGGLRDLNTGDETHWQIALLTGNVRTTGSGGSFGNYSGGLENFPRFLERWSGVTNTIRGSFVIGFNSVFHRQPWGAGNVYAAPTRDWGFDDMLDVAANQPPGAPVYAIQATRRWTSE